MIFLVRPPSLRRRLARLVLWAAFTSAAPGSPATVPVGKIIDRIECAADPSQAYALYLPSTYTHARLWPVIFCFDPVARGRVPVERLQAAAEKYGYLVAGSLNSRNGPWAANAKAAQAMINDVGAHFALDARRIYTAGFSGGARIATGIALSGTAKGVLACSAGFPPQPEGLPPELNFVLFGTVGTEDFNYREMVGLDDDLDQHDATHRIVIFSGTHEWPSAAIGRDAIEWFELQAMRAGHRPRDDDLIRHLYDAQVKSAATLDPLPRWRALATLANNFRGLLDVAPQAAAAKELRRTSEVKSALKDEARLFNEEADLIDRLLRMADTAASKRDPALAAIRARAEAPADTAERRMVRRAIAGFTMETQDKVREMIESADYRRAAVLLEAATTVRPSDSRLWFELARVRALRGDGTGAIAALEASAAAGYRSAKRLESEAAFAPLRHDARYVAVLGKIRETESATAK